MSGRHVEIINPNSTRPWQHVLDPLKGYLMALELALIKDGPSHLNFGPKDPSIPVKDIIKIGKKTLTQIQTITSSQSVGDVKIEAKALDLNSDLAAHDLNWKPVWTQEKAVERTFHWWKQCLEGNSSANEMCKSDILEFFRDHNNTLVLDNSK